MSIRAAIFDLDGTLLDSLSVWQRVDAIFLNARGFEVPDDYQKCVSALTYMETALYTIKRFGLSDTPQELMNEWNSIALSEYSDNVLLMPGARDYLEMLRDSGIHLYVATTMPVFMLRPCLERNKIYSYFEAVFNPDTVGIGKHQPEFFKRVLSKLRLKPGECIVYDDVPLVIKAAAAAGMHTCGMTGGNFSDRDEIASLGRYAESFETAPSLQELKNI